MKVKRGSNRACRIQNLNLTHNSSEEIFESDSSSANTNLFFFSLICIDDEPTVYQIQNFGTQTWQILVLWIDMRIWIRMGVFGAGACV